MLAGTISIERTNQELLLACALNMALESKPAFEFY